MIMGFYITRQTRIDGSHIVEITPDDRAINGDMLRSDYKGESELYDDPQAAAETAILICGQWQHDEPHTQIGIAVGGADGYHPMDADEVRQWAAGQIAIMPRCEWCDEIIYSNAVKWARGRHAPICLFCSMGCIREHQDDIDTPALDKAATAAAEATEAADRELDHAEQVTLRDIEFNEEHRQNGGERNGL
jgi:hypothetical protein